MIIEDSEKGWSGRVVATVAETVDVDDETRSTVDALLLHFARKPRRLVSLLETADIEVSAIFNACIITILGVWLIWPDGTFGSAAAYRPMAMIAPEWTWGVVFILVGLTKLCAILKWDQDGDVRLWRAMAVIATWLWTFTAIMLLIGNAAGIGIVFTASLAILSMHHFGRLVGKPRRTP